MRNLSKRIEALERIVLAVRRERHKIVQRALDRLSDEELVLTMDASFAEKLGRVLTEEESAALQSLGAAVDRGCHGAVPQLAEPFKTELDNLDIHTVTRYTLRLFEGEVSRRNSDRSGVPNHRE